MSDDDWRRARKSRSRKGESERDFPDEIAWSRSPGPTVVATRAARREASPTSGPEVAAVVTRFDATRGFGFVAVGSGGSDVFVHATALQRSGLPTLTEGQIVKVRVIQGKKGPEVEALDID